MISKEFGATSNRKSLCYFIRLSFLFPWLPPAPTQAIISPPICIESEGCEGCWDRTNDPDPQLGGLGEIRVGIEERHR